MSFYEWSLNNGYVDKIFCEYRHLLSIDRIDVDGNYEPSNCQWITISENSAKGNRERKRECT